MFNISSYLEKISKNIHSVELNNKQIVDILEKNTGIKIDDNNIEIKDYTIFIKVSPMVKNKIFIFKERILDEINNSTKTKITNIR